MVSKMWRQRAECQLHFQIPRQRLDLRSLLSLRVRTQGGQETDNDNKRLKVSHFDSPPLALHLNDPSKLARFSWKLDHRADFHSALAGHGNFFGDGNCFVKILRLDEKIAAQLFMRLRKWNHR